MADEVKQAERLRDEFAKKAKRCEAHVRYAQKALARAKARLESADEIVAATRRGKT